MTAQQFMLDRTVLIQATPAVVFGFLTDTPRWAAWWGAGSEIDARPGGQLKICYPGGTEAVGEVIEVTPPERIVFTYGYTSGKMIPPGGSRVTIELEPLGAATRLRLTYEMDDEAVRNDHVQGWRYQLSLFANIVADAVNAGASGVVDAWFDTWADPDAAARTSVLSRIADSNLRFRDRYSNTDGIDDLVAHIAGAQRFMPGIRMQRHGEVRQPGDGAGGLRRAIERRSQSRQRHQRVRVRSGRPARMGHRFHGPQGLIAPARLEKSE